MEQATQLRHFHNEIKSILISKYSSNIESKNVKLLDLGVGRGGDLHKWNKCEIQTVVGIDINKEFILDAIKRMINPKFEGRNYKLYYTTPNKMFAQFFKQKEIQYINTFHIVSCMFAFHYFWESLSSLRTIMKQISESLIDNGYFIGVVPQGDVISKLLKGKDVYTTPSMQLQRCYTEVNHIGDKIKFMLSGTLYFGEKMLSEEYLVFKETFVSVALEYNLHVVEYENFEKYYINRYHLSPPTKEASFVNGVFAFIKKSPVTKT